MAAHADAHPAFARLTAAELAADPCVAVMRTYTEEGKKVERLAGDKHVAVFRRLTQAEAVAKAEARDFWSEPPVAYEYLPARLQQVGGGGAKLESVPGMYRTKRQRLDTPAGAAAGAGGGGDGAPAAASAAFGAGAGGGGGEGAAGATPVAAVASNAGVEGRAPDGVSGGAGVAASSVR